MDTKPFFSRITKQRGFQWFRTCQSAPPLERGARVNAAGQQVSCVLNRAASEAQLPEGGGGHRSYRDERLDQGTSACRPSRPASRVSRKFWSAGDYDAAGGNSAQPPRNVRNRMCVHPKFLHSNATSHKWPFGAVAELLDNAVDEIKSGATRIVVDKVIDKRNGSPALLVQDDGGGMDPDSLRRCMSFGFSDKQSGSTIGQYGNGFKTSTMRLGADVIVFSRCMNGSEPTQSIGLLSYTFLAETDQKDVLVPLVDYKYNLLTGAAIQCERRGADQFSLNLSVLLKWSPFVTEEELMNNFSDIGPHGTKIIVFNLWSNDDDDLELDFDTKEEDIMISGAPKPVETNNAVKRMNENHLSNQLRYSLRVYASILYLQLPGYFKIILRGQEVKRHSIATDLRYCQCITYKPQVWGVKEAEVVTTIGFLDGSPTVNVHGFNIYHKNRLILPFHRILSTASSKGRGVAGVLEANFIKPTHDKQDFEKSQLYQRLMTRLKEMTNEYWDLHSHLVGYHKTPCASASASADAPRAMMLPMAADAPPEAGNAAAPPPPPPLPAAPSRPGSCDVPSNAIPIAFAPPVVQPVPAGTNTAAAARAPAAYSTPGMQIVKVEQTSSPPVAPGTDLAQARKRKNEAAVQMESFKRQATHGLAGSNTVDWSNQVCQFMSERDLKEFSCLKLENKLLRQECLVFEIAETELLQKEEKLRLEIKQAEAQYKSLLNEYISATTARTQKR